jgi:hypothetical protein
MVFAPLRSSSAIASSAFSVGGEFSVLFLERIFLIPAPSEVDFLVIRILYWLIVDYSNVRIFYPS